jgi:hypothetical protein
MRRQAFLHSEQHSLSFTRHDIWKSIPAEHQQQCRELCEQMLRAALETEQQPSSEVDREREVPSRAS